MSKNNSASPRFIIAIVVYLHARWSTAHVVDVICLPSGIEDLEPIFHVILLCSAHYIQSARFVAY